MGKELQEAPAWQNFLPPIPCMARSHQLPAQPSPQPPTYSIVLVVYGAVSWPSSTLEYQLPSAAPRLRWACSLASSPWCHICSQDLTQAPLEEAMTLHRTPTAPNTHTPCSLGHQHETYLLHLAAPGRMLGQPGSGLWHGELSPGCPAPQERREGWSKDNCTPRCIALAEAQGSKTESGGYVS